VLTAHANNTLKIIVPYAPGGQTDIVARVYAKELAKQNIDAVIVNKPGAQGFIGTQELLRSPPNGNTIMFSGIGGVVYAGISNPAAYDAMNQLVPIIRVATYGQMIVAHSSSDIKTFEQLRKALKTRTVAMASTDSTSKIVLEDLFVSQPNAITVHYNSDAQGVQALMSKTVEVAVLTWAQQPRVQNGDFVSLAVVTPKNKNGVPSLTNLGYNISFEGWSGFWLPPGTPNQVRDHWYAILEKIRADKEVQKQITSLTFGNIPPRQTSEEFRDVMDRDFAKQLAINAKRPQ
jgi:tripartite-type tricarboxylate transporter receptor subunit TctC